MDELLKYDQTFSENTFISKANNVYVMLATAITTNNLDRVKHFINDDVYNEFLERLNELNKRNVIQMFDELNVSNTTISKIEINDEKFIIEVDLVSKYLNYRIDKQTKQFVNGDNNNRITYHNKLVFEKKRDFKNLNELRKCPSCGASLDLNNTGICPYCKNIFNQVDYDWILVKFKKTF